MERGRAGEGGKCDEMVENLLFQFSSCLFLKKYKNVKNYFLSTASPPPPPPARSRVSFHFT